MRKLLCSVPAWMAIVFLSRNNARAEEFSFKCDNEETGFHAMITFDDLTKRVVAYRLTDGHLSRVYKGKINSISSDEVDFDLEPAYLMKGRASLGNILNRREGSVKFGQAQAPAKCESIPLRSVMDLWDLLSADH